MVRDTGTVARNFFYDFCRVVRFSSAVATGNSREKLAALITMAYHAIEKGLSLPKPRPGFGRGQVEVLISRLDTFGNAFGFDENATIALNVLEKYLEFNGRQGISDRELAARVEGLRRYVPKDRSQTAGGTRTVKREDFLKRAKLDLSDFFNSRASVRQYSDQPVDLKYVEKAVDLARRTPSCCNRQSGRVWVIRAKDAVQKALDIQGGARGFKEEVPVVLVITSDLACFQSSGERYQSGSTVGCLP